VVTSDPTEQRDAALLTTSDLRLWPAGQAAAPILRGISMDVAHGEIVGLVGESGSGKTLTGMCTMGLPPRWSRTSGDIQVAGRPMLGVPAERARGARGAAVSMVFQEPRAALNPRRRIGRSVADVLRAHDTGVSRPQARQMVLDWLARVGLPDPERCARSFPHELSGGMCQRVCIAMALIGQPQMLIADEPTTALDVTVQAQILALLAELAAAQRLAVLLITHDLGIVSRTCDRLVILYAGEVVEEGTTQEILRRPRHPYTASLLAAASGQRARPGSLPGAAGPAGERESCSFYGRCPHRDPTCAEQHPPLDRLPGEHDSVRCLRWTGLRLPGIGQLAGPVAAAAARPSSGDAP
jgi:peptide/nickel transport system ATP-binding protein